MTILGLLRVTLCSESNIFFMAPLLTKTLYFPLRGGGGGSGLVKMTTIQD